MNSEHITTIESITPIELVIVNHEPLVKKAQLQLNLERELEEAESGFKFYICASVYKKSEKDLEKKSFFVKYSAEAHFRCSHEDIAAKDLYNEATNTFYPYIRAGISATMGAIGILPITLPPYITD